MALKEIQNALVNVSSGSVSPETMFLSGLNVEFIGLAGADEGVHGADEEGTVRGIKALAGFVQNQQAGIFDQGSSKQNHALKARRKGEEGPMREFEQLEPGQPPPRHRSLPCRPGLEKADGVMEAGRNDFEAGS